MYGECQHGGFAQSCQGLDDFLGLVHGGAADEGAVACLGLCVQAVGLLQATVHLGGDGKGRFQDMEARAADGFDCGTQKGVVCAAQDQGIGLALQGGGQSFFEFCFDFRA